MLDFVKQNKLWLAFITVTTVIAILFRLNGFTAIPPSLYWEEVALGYDAYSIALTGNDHHGNPWPIVAFESFGDWKPSLYFYTITPFVKLFGLNAWSVRLPSLLSGLAIFASVGWLSYLVCKRVDFVKPKGLVVYGLIVAAMSPWAIQFSRAGWEVNLATALVSWGMVVGLQAVTTIQKDKKSRAKLSVIRALGAVTLLVLSVYAYHGTRLIAPLLGGLLAVDWLLNLRQAGHSVKQMAMPLVVPAIVAALLMAPILLSLRSPQVTQRFAETSIFSQLDIIVESNEAKAAAGNSWLSSLLYHRYLLFGREVIINYFDHFNLSYLVVSGDVNPRHSSQYGGILLYPDLVFLSVGLFFIVSKKNRFGWLLIGWWLVSIIPASLTTATPHALRTLPGMPAVLTIITIGYGRVLQWLKYELAPKIHSKLGQKSFLVLSSLAIGVVYMGSWLIWMHHYLFVYPKQTSSEWLYGYQEMVAAVNQLRQQHPDLPIYITREQGRPAMYYWFFSKTDPRQVQTANATAAKDQGEFLSFEQLTFPNTTAEVKANAAIVASSPEGKEQLRLEGYTISNDVTVSNLADQPVWQIYRISK